MGLKPSDFYIGVVDFFSVILPGALVAYFLQGFFYAGAFGEGRVFPAPETVAQRWITFLLAAYIAGNLVFAAGALLLDKLVYDKLLRRALFKKNYDLVYHTATATRDQFLDSESWIKRHIAAGRLSEAEVKKLYAGKKREVINTFKWAQLYLSVNSPQTLDEVRKLEADSKFFRSLVVAFAVIGATLAWAGDAGSAACFFALSILSVYRYGDLRHKSTEKAYQAVVTLDNLTKPPPEAEAASPDNRASFVAPAETLALYRDRVAALGRGPRETGELLAITPGETWEVANSASALTLFCLRGRCVARVKGPAGAEQTVALSTDAVASLPRDSSFAIANRQQEPLLLLTLK